MNNLRQKVRSKKLSSRVDLTAMVSVSFLLIIFFMVVGELSKPKVMDLSIPSCTEEHPFAGCSHSDENRTITILLDDNNKIIIYSGLIYAPIETPKQVQYGKNGIRKELFERNKKVLQYSAALGRPERGVTAIIKPSKNSNYGNLVDILDEIRITNINSYSIVDYYTSEEKKLLAAK
ncbi:biopolymer transport protein ExbD [Flavobacterium sp. HSC-32F16]|uniref:ExbD/TolR family protein n=1 Tax=Flavobacterium sp. HSC-32F16 TaxID=2910964 RepID=UPI0020A372C7|nr:biopolymer transporter ExbD [Flavobacterium sp. HSC-32F16]MCP2024888.1 biopolymer transport protein ExbD [Flavobacterium sp. HSC-32F16]